MYKISRRKTAKRQNDARVTIHFVNFLSFLFYHERLFIGCLDGHLKFKKNQHIEYM